MRASLFSCLIVIYLCIFLEGVLILKLIKKRTVLSKLLKINKKTFQFGSEDKSFSM